MTDAPTTAGAPAYRGFLFSDMRGFTAFGERYGNAAAAAAVRQFLDLARGAIARHAGAEIKTEGDAIHAVFPSASSAVLCGMDIVDAAAELNAKQPDRPIGVGVGVHAGEAVETAEGYIGRAVNIAARLCSQARAGEVLVSSTVKGIAQASIPVGFIPRGKRRLKGIKDPIVVYAVTRDMTAKAPRTLARPMLLGASAVAVIAVLAAVAVLRPQLSGTGSQGTASAGPSARPVVIGALPIGTYTSTEFQPKVTFDIGDLGWSASRDVLSMLALVREDSPRGSLFMLRVSEVIASPCAGAGAGVQTAPAAIDVLSELDALDHVTVQNRQRARVGGYTGQQADVVIAQGAQAACGGLVGSEVPVFAAGQEVWSAAPGEQFRLVAVDINGKPLTLLISSDWALTPSVQEIGNMLELGQRILDSVRF